MAYRSENGCKLRALYDVIVCSYLFVNIWFLQEYRPAIGPWQARRYLSGEEGGLSIEQENLFSVRPVLCQRHGTFIDLAGN